MKKLIEEVVILALAGVLVLLLWLAEILPQRDRVVQRGSDATPVLDD